MDTSGYNKYSWERYGSVVECLTGDGGVAGSNLTVSLPCVFEQDILILA